MAQLAHNKEIIIYPINSTNLSYVLVIDTIIQAPPMVQIKHQLPYIDI